MGSPSKKNESKGFFAAMSSMFTSAVNRSVNGLSVEVINPEGGKEDAEEEAQRGRWKQEERDGYWKMMQKYIGSDVTSMVTLPVIIFEPMTMIQKIAELMEYSYLLDQADESEDPYMRLVYATSWAISVYFAYQRTWKPFNPILGETYEMVNHGGITFLAEQVSHHPPMSAAHAENEHFTYDVTSKLKTKFLGNSVDVYPVGRTRVTLKRDGVVLDLVPPPTKVNNLIFGRTWIDSPGEMIMTNLTTGDKAVLYFQPCGWFGAGRYEVDGYIYNSSEEPKILMTGKWNESMSYQPCDSEGEPLPNTELKEVWHVADVPQNDKFQYTHFAHKINSFDTAPRKLLASVKLLENAIRAQLEKPHDGSGWENGHGRFLVDGFPRKMDQAIKFDETVCMSSFVLFFDTTEEVMLERLLERGKTSGREDDNAESIKKRFRTFVETSMPVVDKYRAEGKVIVVDSTRPVDVVHADVCKVLQGEFAKRGLPEK